MPPTNKTDHPLITIVVLAVAALLLLAGVGLLVPRPVPIPRPGQTVPAQTTLSRTLIKYRELQPITIGMKDARGIAVDPAGALWVAGDQVIARLHDEGAIIEQHRVDGEPHCLAVGADGTRYVGMRDHVSVYTPAGKHIAKWAPPGGKACITSLALGKNDIWVADAGNRTVWHYSRTGRVLG
ncbi:MAG TPA: hypothetical protein VGM23_00245, partial [Armatimonadota bacterium]